MENKNQNRLQFETSPYLLQHAANPVDWYPWGDEALSKAIVEDKLILVSVGYAACHWCHVMERQSFEDEHVANVMNDNFICIKVDREERPDVDQVYMNAVQLINGNGGWPLNCFTLPDGSPVYGGTYYPKQDWLHILNTLANYWKNDKSKLIEHALQVKQGMLGSDIVFSRSKENVIEENLLDEAVSHWKNSFDWEYGGENMAPKFPMPNNYEFLLAYSSFKHDDKIDDFIKLTLNKLCEGGIYDHVGGGFARYSVDQYWKVPHFEKMLYDNAQLIGLYSKAYQKYQVDSFKRVVEQSIAFINNELTSPEGGFYSSYDADSEGVEGKFYVWTKEELQQILRDNAEVFCDFYSVTQYGNWEKTNILHITKNIQDIAKTYGLSEDELILKIKQANEILYKERKKRVPPALDDKILTSWNALMISGLIDAYKAFQAKAYLSMAIRNANFIVENLLQENGQLFRNYKNGIKTINAFLDDYSLTADAFIKLFEVTGDFNWLENAEKLVNYSITHFFDNKSGMFFYTSDLDAPLVIRKMEMSDNVIPASNSAMAKNLFLLSNLLGKTDYKDMAKQMLMNTKENITKYNRYYSNWADLANYFINPFHEIVVIGENVGDVLKELNAHFLPNSIVASTKSESESLLFKGRYVEGKTLIYVCQNNTCQMPVETVEEAIELMRA